MKPRTGGRPQGQLRRGQVVTTFGPGSLLDLPNHSVLVGGLDDWANATEEVHEARLVEKLKRLLNRPSLRLFAPPPDADDALGPKTGITAWQFPEWFITQDITDGDREGFTRSRRLVSRKRLTKDRYIDEDRLKHSVVPIRFVRACRRGHIGDIDWYYFVHRGVLKCRRQLWVDERGTSGDIMDISIRCECGARRLMSDAAASAWGALGQCDGARPWLGPNSREECKQPNRLLVRSASNAYFPRIMSVISLPDRNESLEKAVNQAWSYLECVESQDELRYERKKAAVKAALEGYTDDEVFREIRARKGAGGATPVKSVKQAEMEVWTACREEAGNDVPDGNFFARTLPRPAWDKPWMAAVDRVVLVHRLREVIAQVGFTRFEAQSADVEGELEMGVEAAVLAREVNWLPAVENRGEGIFLGFKKDVIDAWKATPAVQAREEQLRAGFKRWHDEHLQSGREFPGPAYVMLHSLSHLLITSVALECGYPASSIRERVYAGDSGYGILLYTGSPDAEGTLGGLVEAGRHIARHMKEALEMGRLCSNDPVCAQHDPPNQHEGRFLLGAACHGCLLIAETSCEQFNDFLDRALVVPTVENLGVEFFKA
jgi:Domain of unknown function (DUF1998)